MSILLGNKPRRPVYYLVLVLLCLSIIDLSLFAFSLHRLAQYKKDGQLYAIAVSGLGLTDLCIATEARYTRHPAVSDRTAPFMDHPGAIEHFPTGSFWAPPVGYNQSK